MMKNIKFYFDFLSPFSYFAWLNLEEITKNQNSEISFHPVLMGRLFSHHNFPGPGEIPAKRDYELKKCFRYAHKNQIKFSPPTIFPFNPLAIIRMATEHASGKEQIKVISEIFDLVWGEGRILEDPELIQELLISRGLNQSIIDKSFERTAKTELKTNIQSAIDSGIFGVPSFLVDKEFFWGNDSIDDLCNFLNNNDNWNKQLYNELSLLK
ncbi:MAG: 2-hydroxychromene-2-carboxylate isomerase [Bacteriovoracaceae bacterium]|jgi:2-hydroxychromene-2-carboxylate isomerase